MKRALFNWDVPEALRAHLDEALADVELQLVYNDDDAIPDADVIVGWKYDAGLLDRAARCALCINPGAGVDLLLELFRARAAPPVVVNGHGNARLTAQGTVALLLGLTHRVVLHDRRMRSGHWRDDVFAGTLESRDLSGRKVALFGFGHVGRGIASLLQPFDVELLPIRRGTPLAPALDAADVLILAAPLTDETRGAIDERALARLGPHGLLVNIARGALVDEDALFDALKSGGIAGAALDAWYDYQPVADDEGRRFPYSRPFHELDNVVLSPHRAASPFSDLERWGDIVDNLGRFARGEALTNIVDLARGY